MKQWAGILFILLLCTIAYFYRDAHKQKVGEQTIKEVFGIVEIGDPVKKAIPDTGDWSAVGEETIRFESPTTFGARNWYLYVESTNGIVQRVYIRTADNDFNKPSLAPNDKGRRTGRKER